MLLRELRKLCRTLRKTFRLTLIADDIGLLTAKCTDLSLHVLIDYSTYFKEMSIQSGVRLIEVLNNRN